MEFLPTLGPPQWAALLLALLRLAELAWSSRNERRLRAAGAQEHGARHYPVMVGLHSGWLVLLFMLPPESPVNAALLGLFVLLLAARVWVIASLGRWWTTRVLTLPGAPLIRRGPYRWLRHPNYLVVQAEIMVLPAAFDAWAMALLFGLFNAALLAWRIRVEEAALAARR